MKVGGALLAALVLATIGFAFQARRTSMAETTEADEEAVTAIANKGHAQQQLNWLSTHGPGWGLSYKWDAFGDGTTNSRSTVYSYTTALAGLAYLANGRRREAVRAADMLASSRLCCWRDGHGGAGIWYSDRQADHQPGYRVYNVSGLTLNLLARLGTHTRLAAQLERGLLNARTTAGWRYMNGDRRGNDLIHATFIVVGLYAAGARQTARAELDRLWRLYLHDRSATATQSAQGSHGWGPSAGLWALATTKECARAHQLAGRLSRPADPRAAAWYDLAVATLRRDC